ncbi:hypothetical protein [Dyella sp. ASV21]|uniref:portal protein n=1 Tax=Dyella sp. ASV21 TaxID=2795114 RepID=UPI0018EE292F|nr:hypothetical protein [Dyella sp. ASV21]
MAENAQPINAQGQPAQKLTNWVKEPDLAMLKADLEAAKPTQKSQMSKIAVWLDHLNITGDAKIKPRTGRSSVQPKLIRKQAEWRYSSLSEPFLSTDKLFTVSPVSWEDQAAAEQNEMVLNWQFRTKLNSVAFVDEFVRTCVDEGTVAVRVAWDRETKMEKVMAPVYQYLPMQDPDQIQALQQAMQMEEENPNEFLNLPPEIIESVRYSMEVGAPHRAEKIGEQEVEQEKVVRNEPTVEVININNLIVDVTCGSDPNKAMFMAYSDEVTRGYLRSDKRFKNLDAVNWGNSILAEPDHVTKGPQEVNFKDDSRQKVILNEWYGLYDIEGNGQLVPIYCAWIGNTMVRCEENPYPDGKPPYVIIPYLPQKRSIYGEPDGALLIDNQKIVGAVTRGMIDTMARSANGQRGMAKSMLDIPNKRRFDAGQDYEFNPNVHPSNGIVEHKFPEIPGSAMGMVQMMNGEAESLTGVKTFSDGGLNGNALGATATGAKGVLSAASTREMGILRRLAKGMSIIGAKIVAMNQEFMSEEEVIRVTNEKFVTVRREDLKGSFDLKVTIATTDEDNAKAQGLEFMLQTTGQSMDPNERRMVMAEIARLRRMPELAHSFKTYQPQPDPIQQQIQQLEIEKLQKEIALLDAKAAEAAALAQRSGAQARNLDAGTDKTNLDFVEQQTGTAHARRMDELAQQADANQNLAITKGILAQRPDGAHHPDNPTPDAPTRDNLLEAFGYHQLTKSQSQHPSL